MVVDWSEDQIEVVLLIDQFRRTKNRQKRLLVGKSYKSSKLIFFQDLSNLLTTDLSLGESREEVR